MWNLNRPSSLAVPSVVPAIIQSAIGDSSANRQSPNGCTAFEPVIGLEIHAQLLTATKIFCGCSTRFGARAQHARCARSASGLPGALPVLNRRAVELATRAALALGCRVTPTSIFARKNYFYPDLPKGYQISQYDRPLATDGDDRVRRRDGAPRRVGIIRVHMEEDAGKSLHDGLRRLGRADAPRLQPQRRAAHRDRHRARPALRGRRGRGVQPRARDAGRDRRQRRQHGGGQPPLRRQRLGAPGGRDRLRRQDRAQEPQLLPPRAARARVRDRAARAARRDGDAARPGDAAVRSRDGPDDRDADARKRPTTTAISPSRTCRRWCSTPRGSRRSARALPELPEARRRRFVAQYALPEYDAGVLTQSMALADYFEARRRRAPATRRRRATG